MPIMAVPGYLTNQVFEEASPGLRFGMFLKLWGKDYRTSDPLWKTHDIKEGKRGPVKEENKTQALDFASKLNENDRKTLAALLERQRAAFDAAGQDCARLRLVAQTTAPFTTGLGLAHPLENGFAFLSPYGLPYLPGSGIKGVLRQAARELASGEWGETRGWKNDADLFQIQAGGEALGLSMLDALFGRETTTENRSQPVRGALVFWDVIPQIPGNRLAVDIMTPHQGHYYQQKQELNAGNSTSPHDSGFPIPIGFLTVPPGSGFVFHVQCDLDHLARLAPGLAHASHWKTLLTAAFEHAFEWLGFGAKTAVGYGAMESEGLREQQRARAEERKAQERIEKEAATFKRQTENAIAWERARIKFHPRNGSLSVEKSDKIAFAHAPRGKALLETLPADLQKKVTTNQYVTVTAFVAEGVLVSIKED